MAQPDQDNPNANKVYRFQPRVTELPANKRTYKASSLDGPVVVDKGRFFNSSLATAKPDVELNMQFHWTLSGQHPGVATSTDLAAAIVEDLGHQLSEANLPIVEALAEMIQNQPVSLNGWAINASQLDEWFAGAEKAAIAERPIPHPPEFEYSLFERREAAQGERIGMQPLPGGQRSAVSVRAQVRVGRNLTFFQIDPLAGVNPRTLERKEHFHQYERGANGPVAAEVLAGDLLRSYLRYTEAEFEALIPTTTALAAELLQQEPRWTLDTVKLAEQCDKSLERIKQGVAPEVPSLADVGFEPNSSFAPVTAEYDATMAQSYGR